MIYNEERSSLYTKSRSPSHLTKGHFPIFPKVTFPFHERSTSHLSKGQLTKVNLLFLQGSTLPKVIFSHLPIPWVKGYRRLSPNGQVRPLTSRHSPPPNWRIPGMGPSLALRNAIWDHTSTSWGRGVGLEPPFLVSDLPELAGSSISSR